MFIPLRASHLSLICENTRNNLVIKIKVHLLLFYFIKFCFVSFDFETVSHGSQTGLELVHPPSPLQKGWAEEHPPPYVMAVGHALCLLSCPPSLIHF